MKQTLCVCVAFGIPMRARAHTHKDPEIREFHRLQAVVAQASQSREGVHDAVRVCV